MQIVRESPSVISQALEILQSGGIVAHATETCYGLACDLGNPDAVEKLFAVKDRPLDQPVSALFADLAMAEQYVILSDTARELAKKYLPGPLTLVLPAHKQPPTPIFTCPQSSKLKAHSSFGLRLSSNPLATLLVSRLGRPITTTSANLHGKSNPYSVDEIVAQFEHHEPKPDLVIDSGPLAKTPPSTIVEVIGKSVRVLRQGDVYVA